MEKTAVHFGGGALGRGLVVPFLENAGYEVVVVDIDAALLEALNQEHGYPLNVTDVPEKSRFIPVKEAVEFSASNESLRTYLKEAEVITTSVRKENLKYVVDVISQVFDENDKKTILCAENVEKAGTFFRSLLNKSSGKEFKNLIIPDTVVDRICASKWPESLELLTEDFGEFGFEKTGNQESIGDIHAEDDLERAFVRKRLLVNTYCDASCFLGKSKGKKYLSEAVSDEEVQEELKPYFDTFQKILIDKYQYTKEEIETWTSLYKKRLSNPAIKRELETVARGLWSKLSYQERFLLPIIQLIEMGENIEAPLKALCHMIESCSEEENISEKLKELWDVNPTGTQIYQQAEKFFQ